MLWHKLCTETTVPREIVSIFRYWYSSQKNVVKWSGTHSNVYGLECGVRQGGLSSPRLFNLYVNQLIGELNSTSVGCHIDGTCINNISYADDMVLLSPSVSAMRNLLSICESYALAHGLKYNTNKSEWILFKSGSLNYVQVPNITLGGAPLKRVQSFKYLGHWVTEDLRDNLDIERERRSLAVRCNMLARRFARCTRSVKLTLFKAYCQTFYTCSLWVNYTGRTVLLRLPWRCSASGMFAEARVDGFAAIMRKRCAAAMARLRGSTNNILRVFVDRWESALLQKWVLAHTTLD
ncbi:hypothetical protein ABMA28_002755 [Loxostege sticticalis]|uniref:Reverse transcriptase domain-containing protein n=1 Tax=Loxostege sticticalis TaxID=481309 RepID=A0ABD0SXW0_LOXSC